jgi:hypothetical protein
LSDKFYIQNYLKEEDALKSVLFNYASEYVIRKFQENQAGLKLHWTHQLPVYADNVNLLGDNMNITKKNTQTLIDASKAPGSLCYGKLILVWTISCHT